MPSSEAEHECTTSNMTRCMTSSYLQILSHVSDIGDTSLSEEVRSEETDDSEDDYNHPADPIRGCLSRDGPSLLLWRHAGVGIDGANGNRTCREKEAHSQCYEQEPAPSVHRVTGPRLADASRGTCHTPRPTLPTDNRGDHPEGADEHDPPAVGPDPPKRCPLRLDELRGLTCVDRLTQPFRPFSEDHDQEDAKDGTDRGPDEENGIHLHRLRKSGLIQVRAPSPTANAPQSRLVHVIVRSIGGPNGGRCPRFM